jgi:hypothetical protein
MKYRLNELAKELEITGNELLKKLSMAGYDEVELPIHVVASLISSVHGRPVKLREHVAPVEHVKISLELPEAKGTVKETGGHLLSIMAAAARLGIGRGSLTTAVKKKLVVPVKTSVGPKRRCMHYFSEDQLQSLQAQQKVLIDTGYRCPQELANEFGVIVDDIARALRGMPAARDSYLLRRKGTPGYARHVSYYHPKSWAGFVKKEVAASA